MYDPNFNNPNGSNDNYNNTEGGNYRADPQNNAQQNTEWHGDCYHSYRDPGAPSQERPMVNTTEYIPGAPPKKAKKHRAGKTFGKVLAGVLACLVISGGSVAGFAALVNNGTIKMSGGSASPAFTIEKNSSSGSASSASAASGTPATATAAVGSLSLEQIAKKVLPSVVCIQNYQVNERTSYAGNFGGQDNGQQNGAANGTSGNDKSGVSPASEGSGIIATSDGYIITNAHVVDGASSLKVILSNGKTYQAKLIGSDSITDLAVIKIEATGLTAAEFGSSTDLQVADTVMAIGNPGGMEFNSSVSVGYVSALNREITNSETGYIMKCIQTDAAINPGNSGGALVNMKGQIVGINSSKIVATGYEGLGFAIPIDEAQPIISELKQYGYVKDRAVLGISGQFIDSMTSRFYGLPSGMYVASVTSSAVSNAGIQKGDVITKINGTEIASQNTITAVITTKKPGDTVTLSVTRPLSGQTFTATVKLSQATGK